MASQQSSFGEELLAEQIEFVRKLKQSLRAPDSAAGQVAAAYDGLLDAVIRDVLLELHREAKSVQKPNEAAARPQPPGLEVQPPKAARVTASLDAFGQAIGVAQHESVSCAHCLRKVAASRFAQHLEKCLGWGRQSRLASRK